MRSFAVCLVFFASGAAALVFETLWFHQTRLVLGSSAWAAAVVPAAFMTGLGLGNALALGRGDRVRSPLRAYAMLELVVATSGVALVFFLPALASLLAPAFRPLLDRPLPLGALRFATAFAALLVPSTAMGLTLPLLVRALSSTGASFGPVLGRLYGWNTLGAVAGALAGEIVGLGALGVRGTALAAGALNVAAAAGALGLARGVVSEAPREIASTEVARARWPWSKLLASFVAGATLLSLEVVWIRFLSLYVLALSLAFAVMLAIVLAGIGAGGLVASRWLRADPEAHRFAAAAALGAGILAALAYAFFDPVRQAFDVTLARWPWQVVKLGVPLMFPVSLASGIIFTLVGASIRAETTSHVAAASLLTLFNTAGAALGGLLAGAVLLPVLGMERSFFAMVGAYAVCAALLFPKTRRARQITSLLAVGIVLAMIFFPFGAMRRVHFASRVARHATEPNPHVDVREGTTETILYVERSFAGRPRSYRLLTNAFSMSSSDFRNRRYMKLFVIWPMAVHPAPRSALLVCFGVGATAKALTDTRELERIDVVDVSRDILEMSRVVYPNPKDNPLSDPRVHVHVEDGRFYLQATDRRFDIITGEPPPPSLDGVEALYSVEYFRLLRDHLNDGGITTYWLPTHSMAEHNSLAVVRAFCDVFDDCSLWGGFGTDLMLVGTRGARGPVDERRFRSQWEDPRAASELHAIGLEQPEQLGALFMGDATYLHGLTAHAQPVVDDFPRRIAPPPLFLSYRMDDAAARAHFERSPLIARLWPETMRAGSLPYFRAQALFDHFAYRSTLQLEDDLAELHELMTTTTLEAPVLWMLGSDGDVQRIVRELPPEELAAPAVAYHVGCRELSERHYTAAVPWFETAAKQRDQATASNGLRAYALFMAGERPRAEQAMRELGHLPDDRAKKLAVWLARTFDTPL